MPRKIIVLLLLCLFCFSTSLAQDDAPELEVITAENAKWLIPLEVIGAGAVYDSFWMNGGATLGMRSAAGIALYETIEHDGLLELAPEASHFYEGLSRPISTPDFQRWYAIEVLPDNRPDAPKQFNVWDLQTGEVLSRISGPENLAAVSPDGEIAAAKTEETIELYSLRTGQRISVLALPAQPYGANFSYDGRYLVVGGGTSGIDYWMNGYLMVYDLIEQQFVAHLEDQTPAVQTARLIFSPDGRFISDAYMNFWEFDAENYRLGNLVEDAAALGITADFISHDIGERRYFVRKFTLPSGEAWQISPSYLPDNAYFVDMDSGYFATSIGNGTPSERTFPNVSSAVYSPDGQTLYYSSPVPFENHDSVLGMRLEGRAYELGNQDTSFFHEDGNFFFSYDRETESLKAFDLRLQEVLLDISSVDASNFAISQNREFIAWLHWDSETRTGETRLLNMNTGEIRSFEMMRDISLSADGRYLTGTNDDYALKVFDTLDNLVEPDVLHWSRFSSSHFFSPDNRYFVGSGTGEPIWLIDLETGEVPYQIILSEGMSGRVYVSQDSEWLMLAGENQYLWRIDDLPEGRERVAPDLRIQNLGGSYRVDSETPAYWVYRNGSLSLWINESEEASFFVTPWSRSVLPSEEFDDYQGRATYVHPSVKYGYSQVYDAVSGDVLRSLYLLPYVDSFIIPSPDGKSIVLVDSRLSIWGVPVPPADPNSVSCPTAPSPELSAGTEALVRAQELRLRSYPYGSIKASLLSGTVVSVERGPICENGLLWWGISNEELGIYGWAAEAISVEDYLLAPAN
jgi:WD40 repeat protein